MVVRLRLNSDDLSIVQVVFLKNNSCMPLVIDLFCVV
jgi:hypothetical protein